MTITSGLGVCVKLPKKGTTETDKEIDEEIKFIKLKLQPLELPEDKKSNSF